MKTKSMQLAELIVRAVESGGGKDSTVWGEYTPLPPKILAEYKRYIRGQKWRTMLAMFAARVASRFGHTLDQRKRRFFKAMGVAIPETANSDSVEIDEDNYTYRVGTEPTKTTEPTSGVSRLLEAVGVKPEADEKPKPPTVH